MQSVKDNDLYYKYWNSLLKGTNNMNYPLEHLTLQSIYVTLYKPFYN